jgi:hypothetical protein
MKLKIFIFVKKSYILHGYLSLLELPTTVTDFVKPTLGKKCFFIDVDHMEVIRQQGDHLIPRREGIAT